MNDRQTCSGCSRELPLSDYHRDRSRVSGVVTKCRRCVSEQKQEYNARLAGRTAEQLAAVIPTEQRCWNCEQVLPADSFARSKHARNGLAGICLGCNRERTRKLRSKKR